MADYETQSRLICIYAGWSDIYKLFLLKLTMAVDNFVFRIIKGAFKCSYQSLMYVFCTIPSNGHTSLSTALVTTQGMHALPLRITVMLSLLLCCAIIHTRSNCLYIGS